MDVVTKLASRVGPSRHRKAVIVAAAVALVGAAILFADWRSGGADSVAAPGAGRRSQTARISSPVMGGTVPAVAEVSGVVTGLAPGQVIWIVVQPAGSNVFQPASKPCTTSGDKLSCPTVEFASPGIAHIIPVTVNQQGQARLRAYLESATEHPAGLSELPTGTWQWGPRVTVTRR
jgi:hypothetical protein